LTGRNAFDAYCRLLETKVDSFLGTGLNDVDVTVDTAIARSERLVS